MQVVEKGENKGGIFIPSCTVFLAYRSNKGKERYLVSIPKKFGEVLKGKLLDVKLVSRDGKEIRLITSVIRSSRGYAISVPINAGPLLKDVGKVDVYINVVGGNGS